MKQNQPFLFLGTTPEGESIYLTGQEFLRFKWIQGISGSGKSTLLAWFVLSLLRLGIIVLLIDPHGDLARLILGLLSASDFFNHPNSLTRLQFIDFARKDAVPAFNVLNQRHINHYTVAQNFLESIHRAFPTNTGTTASLDNTIQYTAFVLAVHGLPITPYLQRFLLDAHYRNSLLATITDQQIIQFFDFTFSDKVNATLIASTMRRLDLLTFSPTLRRSLGAKTNILNWRNLWDKGTSCLISLGGCSESEKRLLGCLLLVSIEQNFLSRLDLPPEKRSPVALIVDEAPLFLSQDETSFTNILEQCRKAGAVSTTFANQTLTQLSKGMLGSLQNALPIIFRAGSSDSSELASRFYRPTVEESRGLFDFLSLSPAPAPGIFSTVQNTTEARMLFENLKIAEAICMLPGRAVKITTPTIPVHIDRKKLALIEQEYAKRLLTPVSEILKEEQAERVATASSLQVQVKRRPEEFTPVIKPSLVTLVGEAATDENIMLLLSRYWYLRVSDIGNILQKNQGNIRTKLNALVAKKLVETVPMLSKGGKPATVYILSGKGIQKMNDEHSLHLPVPKGDRVHGYVEHTLAVNTLMQQAALFQHTNPAITLTEALHERTIKYTPWEVPGGLLVPDLYLQFVLSPPYGKKHEPIGLCFEVDRNSEEQEKILVKLSRYVALISSGVYQKLFGGLTSLTVAFIAFGNEKRVNQLRSWCEEYLQDKQEYAELFLFGAPPIDCEPVEFFTGEYYSSPFYPSPHSLIEKLP